MTSAGASAFETSRATSIAGASDRTTLPISAASAATAGANVLVAMHFTVPARSRRHQTAIRHTTIRTSYGYPLSYRTAALSAAGLPAMGGCVLCPVHLI